MNVWKCFKMHFSASIFQYFLTTNRLVVDNFGCPEFWPTTDINSWSLDSSTRRDLSISAFFLFENIRGGEYAWNWRSNLLHTRFPIHWNVLFSLWRKTHVVSNGEKVDEIASRRYYHFFHVDLQVQRKNSCRSEGLLALSTNYTNVTFIAEIYLEFCVPILSSYLRVCFIRFWLKFISRDQVY